MPPVPLVLSKRYCTDGDFAALMNLAVFYTATKNILVEIGEAVRDEFCCRIVGSCMVQQDPDDGPAGYRGQKVYRGKSFGGGQKWRFT